jgi:hypothetical protein
MIPTTRTPEAYHAVRAAQERKVWGDYAAKRYCALRGVPPSLYRLARQLEAAQ